MFADDIILYVASPKDPGEKNVKINKFTKVTGYITNIQNSITFIYITEQSTREIKKTILFTIASNTGPQLIPGPASSNSLYCVPSTRIPVDSYEQASNWFQHLPYPAVPDSSYYTWFPVGSCKPRLPKHSSAGQLLQPSISPMAPGSQSGPKNWSFRQVLQSKTSIQGPHKTNYCKTRVSTPQRQGSSLNPSPPVKLSTTLGPEDIDFRPAPMDPGSRFIIKLNWPMLRVILTHVWCLRTQNLELPM